MAAIGSFTAGKDGYVGTIRSLTVNVKAKIVANDQKSGEGAPDVRVYAGRAELGAAWKARNNGEEPCDFLSVQLDDPSFTEPIRAALFEGEGAAFLISNRREGRLTNLDL